MGGVNCCRCGLCWAWDLRRAWFRRFWRTVLSMKCNIASGPEIGLPASISAGVQTVKPQNRPSGRLSAAEADFDAFPIRIWPKSGPEALKVFGRSHHPEVIGSSYCVCTGRACTRTLDFGGSCTVLGRVRAGVGDLGGLCRQGFLVVFANRARSGRSCGKPTFMLPYVTQ